MGNKRAYKRDDKFLKIYAVYKGDELLSVGTIKEIAKELGTTEQGIRFYATPTYQKRVKHGNGRKLIVLED